VIQSSLLYSKNAWLSIFLIAAFFFVQAFLPHPLVVNRTDYVPPPQELKYLNAGFAVQAADSFWLRAVQDMDFCDSPINERECVGKSWLFQVIDLTVELDKKFRDAFYYGALALTILISDYPGASVIFDKGVAEFPKDWSILYAAGYHAMIEEQDKLKASRLYLSAVNNGAPEWVRLMAGRLASEGGDQNLAREVLGKLIESQSDARWIQKLKKKIQEVERGK